MRSPTVAATTAITAGVVILGAVGKLLVSPSRGQSKVVAKVALDGSIVRRVDDMMHILDEG